MKGEDIRLAQAFEKAKRDYDSWNAGKSEKIPDNPALIALRSELARVENQLAAADRGP